MSDIVQRLRELATWSYSQDFDFITEGEWFTKAADEIERLRGIRRALADGYLGSAMTDDANGAAVSLYYRTGAQAYEAQDVWAAWLEAGGNEEQR